MISHAGMRSVPSDGGDYQFDQSSPSSAAISVALNCSDSKIPELLDFDPLRTINSHVRTTGTTTTSKKAYQEISNGLQQPQDSRNMVPHGDLYLKASDNYLYTDFKSRTVPLEFPGRRPPQYLNVSRQSSEATLSSTRNGVHGKIAKSTSEKVVDLATASLDLGDKTGKSDSVDAHHLDPTHIQFSSTIDGSTFSDNAIPVVDPSHVIAHDLAVSDSSSISTTACLQQATVDNTQSLNISQTQNALHYANAKTVPGTPIKIYTNAPVPIEHQQKFRALVDFFKRAVDNDSILKHRTKDVNYELRMCGKSPKDAFPTIVVFCVKDLFERLSKLLNSDTVNRQYRQRERSILSPVRKRFSREPPSPKFHFKLVFWRESTTPTKQKSADELIKAQLRSYMTSCGSLVTFQGRTATLAILISVDSNLYGMTVDHVRRRRARGIEKFECPKTTHDDPPSFGNIGDISIDGGAEDNLLPKEEMEECNDCDASEVSWVNDVDYEDLDVTDSSSDTYETTIDFSVLDETAIFESDDSDSYLAGHFVDVSSIPSLNRQFLDWALIKFHDGYFERPNAYCTGANPEEYKFLTEISESPPNEHTAILMISGSTGTREGILLPGTSYLGGNPSQDLCEAWAVDLSVSDSYGVIEGDCGSLVVNAVTSEVYGHVIASNPLGQAYIVPLTSTFDQITSDLGAERTSLPNPVQGLTELLLHYLDNGETKLAAKIISHLLSVLAKDQSDIASTVEREFGGGDVDVVKEFLDTVSKLESEGATDFDLLGIVARGIYGKTAMSLLSRAGVPSIIRIAAASDHVSVVRILIDWMISKQSVVDHNTMVRINDLAATFESRGNYLESKSIYERAYRLGAKVLGDHDPDTMISGNGLGQVLEKCGRYKPAEELHLRVIQARTTVLGADHPDTLTSISNYASALNSQGSYDEAEERSRFVLETRRKLLGEKHIDTMTSMSKLAEILENRGQYSEAEDLNRQVLAMRVTILGPDHLHSLTSSNNLAQILTALGRYWEAEPIARQASEGYEKALGEGHPFTLTSLSNLAKILKHQRRFYEAEQLHKRVLAERENTVGAEHPSTLITVTNLGQLYQSQNKYDAARAMSLRALAGYRKTLGPDHPFTLNSVHSLAYLSHTQKNYAAATSFYELACLGYAKLLDPDHPTRKACTGNYEAMKHDQTSWPSEANNADESGDIPGSSSLEGHISRTDSPLSDPMKAWLHSETHFSNLDRGPTFLSRASTASQSTATDPTIHMNAPVNFRDLNAWAYGTDESSPHIVERISPLISRSWGM